MIILNPIDIDKYSDLFVKITFNKTNFIYIDQIRSLVTETNKKYEAELDNVVKYTCGDEIHKDSFCKVMYIVENIPVEDKYM